MTEVPKIVYDRLRAAEVARAASGPSHPEADLLAAFAEQTLLPEEREGVLEHLAACENCRGLIALTLPPEPALATQVAEIEAVQTSLPSKPEKGWMSAFAWPGLRWAALAAGLVVAGSVVLMRSNKQTVVVVSSSFPTAVAPSPTVPIQKTLSPADQASTVAPTESAKAVAQAPLAKKTKADQGAMARVPSESGMLLADNKIAGARTNSFRPDKVSSAGAPELDSPARRSMNETVEVSAAEAAVDFNAAPASGGNLIARSEAPAVVKTKPAPPEIAAQQVAVDASGANEQVKTSAARASGSARLAGMNSASTLKKEAPAKEAFAPTFTLRIAAGILQRSADEGLTWQTTLHSDHPLLSYAALGLDVWAGGKAGILFHSIDGGVTWAPVQPSIKGQALSADVVGIKVLGPQVLFSTSDNETWSTADGGQTWDKR